MFGAYAADFPALVTFPRQILGRDTQPVKWKFLLQDLHQQRWSGPSRMSMNGVLVGNHVLWLAVLRQLCDLNLGRVEHAISIRKLLGNNAVLILPTADDPGGQSAAVLPPSLVSISPLLKLFEDMAIARNSIFDPM